MIEMEKIQILVVDDDEEILDLVRDTLENEDLLVSTAKTGDAALKMIEEEPPDLVVLDIMMPILNGDKVCQMVREKSSVPIIMLSARGEMREKIKCLNLGADDYLTKPFGPEELMARIKALLRRSKTADEIVGKPILTHGDFSLDLKQRKVSKAGNELTLTPTEFELLRELISHVDEVLTYSHLLQKLWGAEYVDDREYLHVYISRLRHKIEDYPGEARYIVSIPRVGYKFQD